MSPRFDEPLWSVLIVLNRESPETLQAQIRSAIAQAILDRRLLPGSPMPPTRSLARLLRVGRKTALLAYRSLVEARFLTAEPRSGHVVNAGVFSDSAHAHAFLAARHLPIFDWRSRFGTPVSSFRQVAKPSDWQQFQYPFVYGQFDPSLFPMAAWREASYLGMRRMAVRDWAGDSVDRDDPELIRQIQRRVLTRRGIWIAPEEILVTLGAQQAMFIVALLIRERARLVGIEDPCYPDLRNIFHLLGVPTRTIAMDQNGLKIGSKLRGCDYICVSPSHQNPTSITMSLARRRELLATAVKRDFIIIEDDYDSELTFGGEANPSMKGLDSTGRVLYIGSFSKIIAPGLRMGYLVAPAGFIAEARGVRRLILRHPPTNNQSAVAQFLSLGHYDSLIPTLVRNYRLRAGILCDALTKFLPEACFDPPRGGSALWVSVPKGIDMRKVLQRALGSGVVFDSGDAFFAAIHPPLHHFRLGFSSIPAERIEAGVRILARCIRES